MFRSAVIFVAHTGGVFHDEIVGMPAFAAGPPGILGARTADDTPVPLAGPAEALLGGWGGGLDRR